MSHASDGMPQEGRLDLVPMIDCVMLLLLFFIMTSSFTAAERHIQALLGNGGPTPGPVVVPPPTVRIAILPGTDGMARIRIGGGEELRLNGKALTRREPGIVEPELDRFHAAIAARLTAYEQAGPRTAQPPVEIHCATQLPWCLAMGVYDAVRAYELPHLPPGNLPIEQQRSVAFASPPSRNSSYDNIISETQRLEHLR